jgi:hypothetical protein
MRFWPVLVGLLLSTVSPALAQLDSSGSAFSRDYEFASRMQNDFFNNFQRSLVDPVARRMRQKTPVTKAQPRSSVASPMVYSPVAVPPERSVPHQLATVYPPASRVQAETLFRDLLGKYGAFEKNLGIPPRDVAGAVAASIAGNWTAMTNTSVPDAHFKALVEQIRSALGTNPGFLTLSNAQRQEIYQTTVINGMFMAVTQMGLKSRNDPAAVSRMRAAGRANLEQWFPGEADKVRIGAGGLTFAS